MSTTRTIVGTVTAPLRWLRDLIFPPGSVVRPILSGRPSWPLDRPAPEPGHFLEPLDRALASEYQEARPPLREVARQ